MPRLERSDMIPASESDLKNLPTVPEAEASLIASVIIKNDSIPEVAEDVDVSMFSLPRHATIWQMILAMWAEGVSVDLVTLKSRLLRDGVLDQCGGIKYLAHIVEYLPDASSAKHYASEVRDVAARRMAILVLERASGEIRRSWKEGKEFDVLGVYDRVAQAFSGQGGKSVVSLRELMGGFVPDLPKRSMEERGLPSSGIIALDERIPLFSAGRLTCLAGRPGQGKSTLMRQMAEAVSSRGPALIFSLEESPESLRDKFVCSRAHVSHYQWSMGKASKEDDDRLLLAMGEIADIPVFVYTKYALDHARVRIAVKTMCSEGRKPAAFFVDYLQLMRHSRSENRSQAIGETTRALKILCLETGVPGIVLSQMNRGIEGRDDGRPKLSDLRESGDIEQDCDNVLFLHPPQDATEQEKDISVCTVAKQRNGPTGSLKLLFLRREGKFGALEPKR